MTHVLLISWSVGGGKGGEVEGGYVGKPNSNLKVPHSVVSIRGKLDTYGPKSLV